MSMTFWFFLLLTKLIKPAGKLQPDRSVSGILVFRHQDSICWNS